MFSRNQYCWMSACPETSHCMSSAESTELTGWRPWGTAGSGSCPGFSSSALQEPEFPLLSSIVRCIFMKINRQGRYNNVWKVSSCCGITDDYEGLGGALLLPSGVPWSPAPVGVWAPPARSSSLVTLARTPGICLLIFPGRVNTDLPRSPFLK